MPTSSLQVPAADDTTSSASRQHYIDTGHYLCTDGNCPCDGEPDSGSQYMIIMRTVRHFAQDDDGTVVCECGRTAPTPEDLAARHARSPKTVPGLQALPGGASVSNGRDGVVHVRIPGGGQDAGLAAEAALVLAYGRSEVARLAPISIRVVDGATLHTFRVLSRPVGTGPTSGR